MIETTFVLSGGLGLGAFQAGALAALLRSGRLAPAGIAGSSIGAINAAIVAGNAPEARAERLLAFWQRVATEIAPAPWIDPVGLAGFATLRRARNWANVLAARSSGVRGLFSPRSPLSPSGSEVPSLYDTHDLAATAPDFIDFDLLSRAELRCCINTTDVVTGAAMLFDTAAGAVLTPDHLRASGGLLPNFPPMRIGNRVLGDGGFSANLPLGVFLASDRARPAPALCIALDLFSPAVPPPTSIGETIARGSDLQFVGQTRATVNALRREWALRADGATDLVIAAYHPQETDAEPEKPFDFSRETLARRVAAGEAVAARVLAVVDG
ncbi:MAG: hypothetical protein EOP68_08670, partial [Sphingomonas sp.]